MNGYNLAPRETEDTLAERLIREMVTPASDWHFTATTVRRQDGAIP